MTTTPSGKNIPAKNTDTNNALRRRASELKLNGLLEHWDELNEQQLAFLSAWFDREDNERRQNGLNRRLSAAHLEPFKPLADFDWAWPKHCDKAGINELFKLDFIGTATNVFFISPNGAGKSTLAQNLAYTAVMQGYKALFVTAAKMLGYLTAQDGAAALQWRLRYYTWPDVLVIDELGYLSYGDRHADLLFEIVNRRYEKKPIVLTTNRAFSEWGEVFPNAPA